MTKRTRKRTTKAKPVLAPAPDLTNVELHARELAVLWTALGEAVERDSGGGSSDGRRGSSDVHASVVNTDVVSAMVQIRRGLQHIEAQAVALLRLDGRRSTLQTIQRLPEWHRSLDARRQPLAKHIDEDLDRWAGQARRALRLEARPRPFGHLCPYHRRDEPTPLMWAPDRAHLHHDVVIGRRPPKGEPPLRWQKGDAVVCSYCKRSWSGATEQRVLAKLVRDADG